MRHDVQFASADSHCAAWHYPGSGASPAGGRACIVMAHGFGATRDSGLAGYAERFAEDGHDVLAFDYRGFADTTPAAAPAVISVREQRADYHAAIAHARTLADVNPDRVVLWGVSLAGGHVLRVAADDARIAGAIALTPAADGVASVANLLRTVKPAALGAVMAAGVRDAVAAARGRPPVTIAISGPPGSTAVITAPGAHEQYTAIAGPSWQNRTPARVALTVGLDRPARHAGRLRCPVLVQVADHDQIAPPAAARAAAWSARADVRSYPCDHFDIYPGQRWFEAACAHQRHFLRHRIEATAGAAG